MRRSSMVILRARQGLPALNTVLHRLSVLSKADQMRDVTNAVRDPAVQELVRSIRRAYAPRGRCRCARLR